MARQPGQDLRRAALQLLADTGELDLDRDRRLARLSRRDRQLARKLLLGVLRNRSLLDHYLSGFLKSSRPDELPAPVLDILRLALYQLKFLDRVPDHAAVDQAVELTRQAGVGGLSGLVNAVLRNILRAGDRDLLAKLPPAEWNQLCYLATRYSHPEWMVERYLARFGPSETGKLLEVNNTQPPLVLRDEAVAARGVSRLGDLLEREGVQFGAGKFAPECLEISTPGVYPPDLPGFGEGLFYIQDEAAMLVSRLAASGGPDGLAVAACAAPGGKATHLARLLPEVTVLACDRGVNRLGRLKANLLRLGLTDRVRAVCCDARAPVVRGGFSHLVLCDVPCTGTGVIRRKPEIRWRLAPRDIADLSCLQLEILRASAELVAPGGRLVYSTCSLEPEENSGVVENFLSSRGDFRLVPAGEFLPAAVVNGEGCLETMPHRQGIDGAFAALMVKNG